MATVGVGLLTLFVGFLLGMELERVRQPRVVYVACSPLALDDGTRRCPPTDGRLVMARWGVAWYPARYDARTGVWTRLEWQGQGTTTAPADDWVPLRDLEG